MDSAKIQGRRRFIFQYLSRKLSATQMHPLINKAFPCSLSTVQRDIRKIPDWLPGLMNIREGEGDQAFARLIGILHDAQEHALELCDNADNSNARVGALRAVILAVKVESDLRMDTGGIVRAPFRLEHLRTVDDGFDERAIAAIVQNFTDDERMRARRMVEPSINPDGVTAVEVSQRQGLSAPTAKMDSGLTPPRPHGCDECRLWMRSCAGPQDGDLDDMGKCMHIQPWIKNRNRGLSA